MIRALVLCILVVVVDAHAAAVAVLPIAGRQSAAERAAMTTALREELRTLDVDVLGGPETDRVIESASALGGACAVTTAACALQLGGLVGVTTVVIGVVDSGQLTVRALDVASEREVGRVTLPVDVASPRSALRLAGLRLLRPEREVGQLALFVDVSGAIVSVDGRVVGRTPVDLLALRPGVHEVVVSHADHETQVHRVEIVLQETATLLVQLGPATATTSSPSPAPVVSDEFRQVVVLDVRPPALARDDEMRLLAALTTLVIVDELQRRSGVLVVSPSDLARAPGGMAADLAGCVDDDCLRRVLAPRFAGDVVISALIDEGDGVTLVGRRLNLGTGEDSGPTSRRVPLSTPAQRQRVASVVSSVVDTLFPEFELRTGLLPDPTLRERFAPPPVPLLAFVGTVGAMAGGAVVTGVTAVAWAGASAARDPAATWWGAGAIVGGVVTAAGLAGSIIEAPFVDWAGLGAANAALLDEVDHRRHSSR